MCNVETVTITSVQEREKICQELKEREISWYVHFTQVKNLDSILEHGLCPRSQLEQQHVSFKKTDGQRLEQGYSENTGGAICLSVMFPNYRMFCKKQNELEGAHWCVLLLDAEKITNNLCVTYFSSNAASKAARNEGGQSVECFERMFADKVEDIKRANNLPLYFPTDSQAELQVDDIIPADYIQCVEFEEQRDFENYKLKLEEQNIRHWSKEFIEKKIREAQENKNWSAWRKWRDRDYFSARRDCGR